MGDKQSHMVIRLLMVTKGLCFLCLPQRQHYKATQCHSRVLYSSTESQALPFSHLSKQHDWAHHYTVIKQLGLFFVYTFISVYSTFRYKKSGICFKNFLDKLSHIISFPERRHSQALKYQSTRLQPECASPAHLCGLISHLQGPAPHSFHANAFPQTGIKMLLGSQAGCPQTSPSRQTLVLSIVFPEVPFIWLHS